jgi:hypothetical protein
MEKEKRKINVEQNIKFNNAYIDFMNNIKKDKNIKDNKNDLNKMNENTINSINSIINNILSIYNSKNLNSSIYQNVLTLPNLSDDPLDFDIQLDSLNKKLLINKKISLNNIYYLNQKNNNQKSFVYTKKIGLFYNKNNQSYFNSVLSERKNSENENNNNSNISLEIEENYFNKNNKYEDLTFEEYLNEEIKQIKKYHSIQNPNNEKNDGNNKTSLKKEDNNNELKDLINQLTNNKNQINNYYSNPNIINLNPLNNNQLKIGKRIKTPNLKRQYKDPNNILFYNSNSSYSSYNHLKKKSSNLNLNYSNLNIIKNKNDKLIKKNIIKNINYHSFRKGSYTQNKNNYKSNTHEEKQKNLYIKNLSSTIQLYDEYKKNSPYKIKQKGIFNKPEKKENKTYNELTYRQSLTKSIKKFENYFNNKPKILMTSATSTNISINNLKNKKKFSKSIITDINNKESIFNIKIDIRDLMKDDYDEKLTKMQKSNSEKNLINQNKYLNQLSNYDEKNIDKDLNDENFNFQNSNDVNLKENKTISEKNELNRKSLDNLIISKQKVDEDGNIVIE